MRSIKLLTATLLFCFIVTLLLMAKPVSAAVLSIQQLPSYITTNNFKLSCTANGGTVQFSYSKNGGAFTDFGPAIDTSTSPCVVQVDSSVVNDQTTYTFSVGGQTTTTFYDISGPSPVSNYYKERINDGLYRLHWTNPGDSDFAQVVIYRGDTAGFSADSSHEIARVSGGANSDMSYDDSFPPDASITYYYALRALDKAGNSSSLVGDAGTIQGSPSPAVAGASTTAGGAVTKLPKEQGEVLPAATESPSPSATPQAVEPGTSQPGTSAGLLSSALSSTRGKALAAAIVVGLLALGYYYFSRRKSS